MSRMKNAPLKLLVCFVDKDISDMALKIIETVHEDIGISNFVNTSVRSGIIDMLGLGSLQRVMITTLVRVENATRLLQGLDLVLCPEGKSLGMAFTVPLSAISREGLNYIKEKNHWEEN